MVLKEFILFTKFALKNMRNMHLKQAKCH